MGINYDSKDKSHERNRRGISRISEIIDNCSSRRLQKGGSVESELKVMVLKIVSMGWRVIKNSKWSLNFRYRPESCFKTFRSEVRMWFFCNWRWWNRHSRRRQRWFARLDSREMVSGYWWAHRRSRRQETLNICSHPLLCLLFFSLFLLINLR